MPSRVLRIAFWTLTALLLPFLAIVARPMSQTSPAAGDGIQSTMSGVYTAPQARRGEETYMAVCVSCHPAGTYKTAAFKETWKGRLLFELYDQVREKMPKNDPASLTPGEYAQVIAYLLKINDVPPGESELPADSEALKKIRIEMTSADRHN
jgi:Cytochrome C oxidase, cbb3-type, subunit III